MMKRARKMKLGKKRKIYYQKEARRKRRRRRRREETPPISLRKQRHQKRSQKPHLDQDLNLRKERKENQ